MIPEFDFIAELRGRLPTAEGVGVGIGDDAAVLAKRFDLLTTDMLVEGVHFRRDLCSAAEIGWRAVVSSLSDIAAMGGAPGAYVVSLAVGSSIEREDARGIVRGMREAAEACGVGKAALPVGGDLSSSPGPTVLSVAMLGEAPQDGALLRSGAQPDDRLVVVGQPGESAAGLRVLEDDTAGLASRPRERLVEAYCRPRAEVAAGRWFGDEQIASALIDVSDGLAADLEHVAEASCVGARVELAALPVSPPLERFGRALGEDPARVAAGGGEDFCLLAAVPPEHLERLHARAADADWPCAEIGAIVSGESHVSFVDENDRPVDVSSFGYEHFADGS